MTAPSNITATGPATVRFGTPHLSEDPLRSSRKLVRNMAKRVVLAYSGGLDTSVAVRWMIEEMGVEVITVACDVGQGGDWDAIKDRARRTGALKEWLWPTRR